MGRFDAVILGAGPSGLGAAYRLARAGARVAVVERSGQCGGLMRGVRRGDFHFDIGRKELYTRFHEVDELWTELLGGDFREYEHRVGMFRGGRIIEKTAEYQGRFRGLSGAQLARMAASYVWSQMRPGSRWAANREDYYLLRYGRAYYDAFVYGFERKFNGAPLTNMPSPEGEMTIPRFGFVQNRLGLAKKRSMVIEAPHKPGGSRDRWRHPALGTQQIIDRCESGARAAGAEFLMNTDVAEIRTEGGRVRAVLVRENGVERELEAGSVIAGTPMPLLMKMLRPGPPDELRAPPKEEVAFRKSTALVYLMAEGAPAFPHNWVEVNDMALKVGRVVNYGTWNGDMTPRGKTGLCAEYFCVEGDGLIDLGNDDLRDLALREAETMGMIDRKRVFDTLVLKLPHANAATITDDWKVQWMQRASAFANSIGGLYEINRPGMDRATLAGLDAAEACRTNAAMNPRSLEKAPG